MGKSSYVSPFAQKFPEMPKVAGVKLAAAYSGMRYKNRDDVFLAVFEEGTTVAGCFTKNTMPGEPIKWGRKILKSGKARALMVNAGYANVWTGKDGYKTVVDTAAAVAKIVGCRKEEVHVSSTGIIGEPIKREKLLASIPALYENLGDKEWQAAALAFRTTDTFAKGATRKTKIGGKTVTLNGIIKGSGMIAPNMATTLSYIFTDAAIPAKILQQLLNETIDVSLNSATVDGDTSTSDTCLVFATGKAKNDKINSLDQGSFKQFRKAFQGLMIDLAKLLVMDGEGITKFITIKVKGAKSQDSARRIGLAIANSPLVKTAIAAQDPNWGRIAGAIGKSGEKTNPDKTSIWLGEYLVGKNGALNPKYVESEVMKHMKKPEITITADVGVGKGQATVWTCDLTHEYININSSYRS